MIMRNSAHWAFLTPSLLLWLAQHSSASLPYNAAYIFPSSEGSDTVYLIQPSDPDTHHYELTLIELNSKSISKSPSRTVLSSPLPFIEENQPVAFTPIVDDVGNLYIYAGNCSSSSASSQIWKFSSENESPASERQWRQQIFDHDEGRNNGNTTGANFLAAGIYYTSVVSENASSSSLYIFGGMCPDTEEDGDSWTSGNYSNVMLRFDTAASQDKTTNFDLDLISAEGPPVAEAGFSITPLQATYTNVTDGIQNKQQDYLLIGGQTESAFINMSQVALFSLPQESWTFLPILQPNEVENGLREKEAAAENQIEIEPRSGHSAVLSSDGRRIFIYGGWVGDVETPAQPQLAMLEVGSGYGGDKDWAWRIPQTTGSGLEDTIGIYGHGATVLPDDMLMIAGGYIIQPKGPNQKRENLLLNEKLLFFNMSSYTWEENYSSPITTDRSEANANGPLSTAPQKIGLSAGLTIAAVILGIILFFLWRRRKYKKSISIREKNIRQLSLETSGSSPTSGEMRSWFSKITSELRNIIHRDHSSLPTDETSLRSSDIFSTNSQNFMHTNQFHYNFEPPEPLVEVPSPTRFMRKPVPSRFHGTSTNPFYEKRPRSNAGYIHPIDEEEEDEEEEEEGFPIRKSEEYLDFAVHSGAKKIVTITTPKLHSILDPISYQDRSAVARRASIRNHPSLVKRYDGEGQALNASHASSSDAELISNGRGSPDKSERTISSLSEQSHRSNWSTNSSMREIGGATLRLLTRSVSGGSSALQSNSTDPFITPRSSPIEKKASGVNSNFRDRFALGYSSTPSSVIQSNVPHGEAAFATGSGFSRLQAEGEALLGGASRLDEMLDDFERINERVADDNGLQLPDTPRKNKTGWIGSVRRALARTTSGASTSRVAAFLAGNNNQGSNRQLIGDDTFDVPYTDRAVASIPRRAVSDGGFWRGRRGALDWANDSDVGDLLGRRSGDDWGGPEDLRKRRNSLMPITVSTTDRPDGSAVEGEDWDVEAAVERRVVQVSFTVPKTRLRVVNVDADKGSLISVDDRKASESLRQS